MARSRSAWESAEANVSFGVPIVATSVGGIPELVENESTGYLVAPDDEQALAAAITQLIQSPELRAQMGEAARRRVKKLFNVNRMADEYAAVFSG